MNDVTREPEYRDAIGDAMTLPTFVLRVWERRASKRAGVGRPPRGELARLVAVRTVLRERSME